MNVYLDYAATAPLRPEVLEAMLPFLKGGFGNPDSLHGYGREAAYAVTNARDAIASVLGVKPSEVYFTSGGTEADNWAVRCLGRGRALLSPIEHAAALSSAPKREGGYALCSAGEDGIVSVASAAAAFSEDTGLLCVMAVNNETGCIQPVRELAELAHARGALFFSDCVQAACTQDLKAVCAQADAVALSAHKLGGPKGVGALVVKRGCALSPLLFGGEQERSLRGGTTNVPGVVGFARALALVQEEREKNATHVGILRDLFERFLAEGGAKMRVNGADRAPNISNLTFAEGGETFLNLLDLRGVAASGGAACSAHASLPSHVLLAMGRSEEEAKKSVRFSFGRETTEEEVRAAANTVLGCLGARK